jgi:peptidoglycan-associated lipoprotein
MTLNNFPQHEARSLEPEARSQTFLAIFLICWIRQATTGSTGRKQTERGVTMRRFAIALTNVILAVAIGHLTACSSAKPAQKAVVDDEEAKLRAEVKALYALIAQGPLYFETDTDVLTEHSQHLLRRIAQQMFKVPKVRVVVAGHADERGDTAYNLALGERRGHAAAYYLMRLGVPRQRIEIVSLGEELPMALGHDEIAWSKNRRDEFTFLMPGQDRAVMKMGLAGVNWDQLLASTSLPTNEE